MFLGRHSLEHVKLGSSGVKEKQEQLLLNTKQHMESHLHREQVLGNEKKKKARNLLQISPEKKFLWANLEYFLTEKKNKSVAYSSMLPRDTTEGCPEMLLCAAQRCHCTLPIANSNIFKQKYWQSYTFQVQVLIKIIFQVSLLLLCMCFHMGMYLCQREGVYMCMHGWRDLVSSSITLCLFVCSFWDKVSPWPWRSSIH